MLLTDRSSPTRFWNSAVAFCRRAASEIFLRTGGTGVRRPAGTEPLARSRVLQELECASLRAEGLVVVVVVVVVGDGAVGPALGGCSGGPCGRARQRVAGRR